MAVLDPPSFGRRDVRFRPDHVCFDLPAGQVLSLYIYANEKRAPLALLKCAY
jgi:hypothetical protein